jgi:opacity protein-like surface antigen
MLALCAGICALAQETPGTETPGPETPGPETPRTNSVASPAPQQNSFSSMNRPMVAAAAPFAAGPYLRLGAGPSFFQDGQLTKFSTPNPPRPPRPPSPPVSSPVHYQTGLAVDAALGWAFNQYAAADFETGYIGAKINNVPGYSSDNSRLYTVPFLFNFTLSYPIPRTVLVPYIGAGIGGADVVFDTDNFCPSPNNFVVGSESDVVFAEQVFGGLRFRLNPNMSLDLGYKYFATDNPTFTYPPGNVNVGFRGVQTHSIMFAFVWRF